MFAYLVGHDVHILARFLSFAGIISMAKTGAQGTYLVAFVDGHHGLSAKRGVLCVRHHLAAVRHRDITHGGRWNGQVVATRLGVPHLKLRGTP